MKKTILILGPFLPGKSFGGPVKSLINLVETLHDNFNFYVVTGDRDLNARDVYNDVEIGSWNQVGKANVFYVPKGEEFKYIRCILKNIDYDLVYTSSFFSKNSLIIQILKYLNMINKPVIVAPRGEFSSGALAIKSTKKKVFLGFYKLLKVSRKLSYTCTSINDKQDILNVLGNHTKLYTAGNIVSGDLKAGKFIREKSSGYLKIVTVSRISKIKNIDYSLRLLQLIDNNETSFQEIIFDIYGPLEDSYYWDECLSIISNLSEKIIVNYKGPIDYSEVIKILPNYHILLFPTKGENFGHVIQEAFISGCPVITSDQTPWRDMEELEVGYDISLENQGEFIEAVKRYLYLEDKDFKILSFNAYNYGVSKVKNQSSVKEHIDMFNNEMKI